jgi:hypothetical protein
LDFYNNVINELIKSNITPMVRSQKYSEIWSFLSVCRMFKISNTQKNQHLENVMSI